MTLQRVLADPATTGNWTLVPDRSSIRFGSKTLWGLVPVNGRFTDITGEGSVAADGAVSGHLRIGVASMKTGIGKRDEHLQSADFFDTGHFPEITVENVKKTMGLDITIVTTADTDDEGRELLKLLGMPFRRIEPQPVQQKPAAA